MVAAEHWAWAVGGVYPRKHLQSINHLCRWPCTQRRGLDLQDHSSEPREEIGWQEAGRGERCQRFLYGRGPGRGASGLLLV